MAGTGSQSGNSVVAGRIAPTFALPSAGAVTVNLRPLSWTSGQSARPGALQTTMTDLFGNYRFQDVPHDNYRVEARWLGFCWSKSVLAAQDTDTVATGWLQPCGKLVLEIEINDSLRGGSVKFYGLDRTVKIPDTTAREILLTVDSLPVGLQTMCVYSKVYSRPLYQASIRIGPDSTSNLHDESWVAPTGAGSQDP